MAGLRVTANVTREGDVSAALSAMAEDTVNIVKTFRDPCPLCVANAASDDPIRPPLHANCHCRMITVTVREIIEASV